jgi:hypothetical protein
MDVGGRLLHQNLKELKHRCIRGKPVQAIYDNLNRGGYQFKEGLDPFPKERDL